MARAKSECRTITIYASRCGHWESARTKPTRPPVVAKSQSSKSASGYSCRSRRWTVCFKGLTKVKQIPPLAPTPKMRRTAKLFCNPKPNDRHWYTYDVEFSGEFLVTGSRDPEHDLARSLLACGLTGTVSLLDGKTGAPRANVNIEKAATWCVGSNLDTYRFKSVQASNYSPPTGEDERWRSLPTA